MPAGMSARRSWLVRSRRPGSALSTRLPAEGGKLLHEAQRALDAAAPARWKVVGNHEEAFHAGLPQAVEPIQGGSFDFAAPGGAGEGVVGSGDVGAPRDLACRGPWPDGASSAAYSRNSPAVWSRSLRMRGRPREFPRAIAMRS